MKSESISDRKRTQWETPDWLFRLGCGLLQFQAEGIIDLAATADNTKSDKWIGEASPLGYTDSLSVDWDLVLKEHRAAGFCNPPWHRISDFVRHGTQSRWPVIWVLPARLEARWVDGFDLDSDTIYVLTPRVNYVHPETKQVHNGIACGSMIVLQNDGPGGICRLDVRDAKAKGEKSEQ